MQSLQFSKYFPLPKNGGHFEFSNFCQKWQNTNFASISLTVRDRAISSKFSTTRVSKECNLCNFAKIRKFKMAAIFGEGKIFGKLQRLHSLDTLWVENFDEIALSRTVKEIEANLCFAIFGKNSKIQNGRHFWGGENFLKIANITFLRYPVGRKFRRNRSISHG